MNSQPDTSDEWLNRILSIAVPYMNEALYKYPDDKEHMIKGFQNTQGYKEAKQAITAHINKAVLVARIDEIQELSKSIERIEDNNINTGMSYWAEDRIAELTTQLEQDKTK